MNNLNPSRKPAAVRRAVHLRSQKSFRWLIGFASRFRTVEYMKHLNHITLGFVITFVLVGCLATAAQGAGVFTSTGSLITGRSSHSATLLPNGQVLVAGGRFVPFNIPGEGSEDYVNINSAELYDPATGYWSPTGSMGTISGPNVATLLPNSKVLCGVGSNWELYDPATGTWTPTGSPSNPNSGYGHTAAQWQGARRGGVPRPAPARNCMIRPPALGRLLAAPLRTHRSGHAAGQRQGARRGESRHQLQPFGQRGTV